MALEKNKMPIALGQGVDTKTDSKQLQPGKFLTLENAVFLKNGSIQKCNGYAYKNAIFSGDITEACATLKDGFFALSQQFAYAYSPTRDQLNIVGKYVPITIGRQNGIGQDPKFACCAFDPIRNTLVYVWEEYDASSFPYQKIKYLGIDVATNSVCLSEALLNQGRRPRIVTGPNMDYFLVLYTDSTNNLIATAIWKNDLNYTSIVTLDSSASYDTYGYSLYNFQVPYAAWSVNAGADTKVAYFTNSFASFAAPSATTISGSSCKFGSDMLAFGNSLIIVTNSGTQVKTIGYNFTLTSVTNASRTVMAVPGFATTLSGVVCSLNESSNIQIFSTVIDGVSVEEQTRIDQAIVTPSSTITAQRTFLIGGAIAGNIIQDLDNYSGSYYLPVTSLQIFDDKNVNSGLTGFHTLYLVRASAFENPPQNSYVAAKFYDLNAPQVYLGISTPPDYIGHPDYITFVLNGSTANNYFGLVKEKAGNASLCTIAFKHKPIFAELANNLHTTGGYMGMFDGNEFAEHGFMQYPMQCLLSSNAGAGFPAGTYYYCYTYEWQDAYGQVHESAPSDPVKITLAAAVASVSVRCSVLHFTNKTSQIYIAIYRSTDGVLFQKLPETGFGSVVQSFKNNISYGYTDNKVASDLVGQPFLYTSGGELSNASPPACTYLSVFKRRLIAVPSEDINSVWYSKEIIPATTGAIGTPVSFASEFVLSVDEKGGPVTGCIQLDDKLLIFKPTTISVVTGQGPSNNGFNNDFSTPQIIASDTGASYGRSLVLTPIGIMFQSPKGYYIVDRSLSVSYIGAPVEDFNAAECLVSVLMFDRNEVWFGTNTSNNVLVYNYYFNQWSTLKWQLKHACLFQNKFTSLTGAFIAQETIGSYQRAGVGYAMKITTGWMNFADVQGFQRVYKLLLLGDYKSAHRLQVQVSVDFDDTVIQTSTITATSSPPYQYRVFMTRQKCESIKFTIQDLAPSVGSWNEGYNLSNMAFEVGIKKGLNKLSASKSVG